MQHSDKDSTLSRAENDIVRNEKERQLMPHEICQNFLKLKAVGKAGADRKQGVDILSTSGLHKNTVCYLTNDLLFYTNTQKRNLQLQKCTQDKSIVIESTIRIFPLCIIINRKIIKCKISLHYRNPSDSNNYTSIPTDC